MIREGGQVTIPNDQSDRFRFRLSRETNGLHLHSISILSFPRSHLVVTLLGYDRYVVTRLYLRRIVSRFTTLSRNERIQSDY